MNNSEPALAAPGHTERVSEASRQLNFGGHRPLRPSISADGRYVAFQSEADNLVPHDDNGGRDVFVHDRQDGSTERVSVADGGSELSGSSLLSGISPDGRFVAFSSSASNLPGADEDNPEASNLYVRDLQAGLTELVSMSNDGEAGNDFSYQAALSADGRLVAFTSSSTNLTPDSGDAEEQVYLRDRAASTTRLISVNDAGVAADGQASGQPAISADGQQVAFQSYATNLDARDADDEQDIYVHDLETAATELVSLSGANSKGNGASADPTISSDGRIAFWSSSTNLVPGDSNGAPDVFVRDLASQATERASVPDGGGEANGASYFPAISADGNTVAFISVASNLVAGTIAQPDVYIRDLAAERTERVSVAADGGDGLGWFSVPGGPSVAVSADGNEVAFEYGDGLVGEDTNEYSDLFVRDRSAATTELVSVRSQDLEADRSSQRSSVSTDGRYVAFSSSASNLVGRDVNGFADIFRRDRQTGLIRRLSVPDSTSNNADGESYEPSVSADGQTVAFSSNATNLVSNDTNESADVFVRDENSIERISVAEGGEQGDAPSFLPSISPDGRYVAFQSLAGNLVDEDTNETWDVFVHDRVSGATERVA